MTTILSVINKPALPRWAAKSVAEYAVQNRDVWGQLDRLAAIDLLKGAPWRYTEERRELGSAVHDAVEAFALGQPMPEWSPAVEPYMRNFQKFLDEWHPTFEASETSVYSREHGYAGTLDLLVWIGNDLVLLDVKTGKSAYPEVAMQLCAYKNADFIGLNEGIEVEMPEVAQAGVLLLRPRHYEVIPAVTNDDVFEGFLAARDIWNYQAKYKTNDLRSQAVLGRRMSPPQPLTVVRAPTGVG